MDLVQAVKPMRCVPPHAGGAARWRRVSRRERTEAPHMVIEGPLQAIHREHAGLQGAHAEADLDSI